MIIGITGHTSGIGKWTAEKFTDHTVIGASRSNGYNICEYEKIISLFESCDVIFNNAYDGIHQSNLLEQMYYRWGDTEKTIINTGSYAIQFPAIDPNIRDYVNNKRILNNVSMLYASGKLPFKSIVINLGPTDTQMVAIHDVPKLQKQDWFKILDFVMDSNFVVPEVTVYAE